MKVEILGIKGTWREIADAARTTIGKESGMSEPSSEWKRKILLAEHSPIRKLIVSWKWYNLPWWVQTHFTRHKFGVEWFVQTSRSDRTGVNRATLGQNAPVNVEGEANAQAIINISRKRLCWLASSETRVAWANFLQELYKFEPELSSACVTDCIYRGRCYEYRGCGWDKTEVFQRALKSYREGWELDD
ncbi:MAG: hypothetical protein A4E52_01834 [Pelotomaculum sp. PtaB.Bin013]|nr:MAG: hypothetical protein A4E52_01834 [Pelotomaculum sp. PtaB.Bin013]